MNKLLLILLFLFVGCENVSKTEHASEGSALEQTFIRRQKRVVRCNCKGDVTSDKIETINGVNKTFTVKPKSKTNLHSFDVTNESTKSNGGWLGLFREGVFTLDLASTVFYMKANEGLNKLNWAFKYCLKCNPDGTCAEVLSTKESGTLFIHISEEKVFEEGKDEIKPAPESCKA